MKIKLIFLVLSLCLSTMAHAEEIRVGSKAFTEGCLLGELAAQQIEATGQAITRKFGLGSTGIVLEALTTGAIDVYPEYTGTIAEAVFHDISLRDRKAMELLLAKKNLIISKPLGFQNTYALAVRKDFAQLHGLQSISDLKNIASQIKGAFSHEFTIRADGIKSIEKIYGFQFGNYTSIEHNLSFRTIAEGKADVIAVYSTDDMIRTLDLVLLQDDRKAFPPYEAVFLARKDFAKDHPDAWEALNDLSGSIDEKKMQELNGKVERNRATPSSVISSYLGRKDSVHRVESIWSEVSLRTKEHLFLVVVSMLIASVLGIPMGILASRYRSFGQIMMGTSSTLQTIPSLALLSLLIPFLGIGQAPALVALCLYSLLPIILNTNIGMLSIDPSLLETARAIGLTRKKILLAIELPLASRSIIGGLRTATVIGIGTATIAALIGGGGYGVPIITGISTNDTRMILTGAVPCAAMALFSYIFFDLISWIVSPSFKSQKGT